MFVCLRVRLSERLSVCLFVRLFGLFVCVGLAFACLFVYLCACMLAGLVFVGEVEGVRVRLFGCVFHSLRVCAFLCLFSFSFACVCNCVLVCAFVRSCAGSSVCLSVLLCVVLFVCWGVNVSPCSLFVC